MFRLGTTFSQGYGVYMGSDEVESLAEDHGAGIITEPVKAGKTSEMGQDRRFEERYSNDCFLIRKRPLRAAPMNGRLWPKAAVALKPSRMSELGQQRTLATYRCHVCFEG